jgi:hypothetical protein
MTQNAGLMQGRRGVVLGDISLSNSVAGKE